MPSTTTSSAAGAPVAHGPLSGAVRAVAGLSARRPKAMIVLWLALIAGCLVAGNLAGTRKLTETQSNVGEARQAQERLDAAGLQPAPGEAILVRARDHAGAARAVAAVRRGLARSGDVRATRIAAARSTPGGGRLVLLSASLRGDPEDAADRAASIDRATAAAERAAPGVAVLHAGDASFSKTFEDILSTDLGRAESISLPITLLILAVAFGALVAAFVPLVLGITAVAGAVGGLGLVSHVVPVSDPTTTLVTLIGLAVGIDYSLFYVRREREERRRGRDPHAALDLAAATVGRAVVVSGLTVMVAVAGLLLTGMQAFASMALGTMAVVVLAVIGSVTVLPAMLALLGDRVDRGRLPRRLRPRLRVRAGRRGAWAAIAGAVARRPAAAMALVVAVLGALALPATGLHTGSTDASDLPAGTPVVRAQHAIEHAFGSTPSGAQVVVSGTGLRGAAAHGRLVALGQRAARAAHATGAVDVTVARDGRTARIDIPMPAGGDSAQRAAVERIRAQALVAAGTALPGAHARLSGRAASSVDFNDRLRTATPIVVGVVLLVAMLLLVAAFRSPVLAVGVMGLNLLSVGAAYGLLVLVFQHGWGDGLLGFTPNGRIIDWLPLLAFVILFGLSMDYTILVLERVREARASGRSAREAAAEGVGATAGVVTSAALVMVAVFAPYIGLRLLEFQQFGLGMAGAVLIDATIVRGIGLPALIALVGERRWPVPVARPRRAGWDNPRHRELPVAADA